MADGDLTTEEVRELDPKAAKWFERAEKLGAVGDATSKAGCAITQFVYAVFALAILGCCMWSFIFGGK